MPQISSPSSARQISPDQDFSLLAFTRVISLRRTTIFYIVCFFVACALLYSLLTPTRYAAQATLEVNPENAATLEIPSDVAPPVGADYALHLSTQARVLQSDTLALAVIQTLKLEAIENQRAFVLFRRTPRDATPLEASAARRSRMLKRFHRQLRVSVVGGTRMIEVSYLDRDPKLAADVVNALLNAYLDQYFQTRSSATHQASEWLSKQLADLKDDVEASQQRLADYQRQTGLLGESETHNVVMAKLEELNRQLSAAEANRITRQAVWQIAKTGDPELISSIAGASFVPGMSTSPAPLGLLPTLRAQEAQLKADIAQTASRLGPAFPKLQQMRSQLADLENSIQLEIQRIAARAQNDYIAAQNAENMERALFEKQKQEANQLNDSAVQYGMLKREVDARRDLYQGLVGKLKQAGVLAGLRSSNIVIVDPARPPAKPSTPSYPLNFAFGLGLGLASGVGTAFIRDSLDRRLRRPEDILRTTGTHPIALLPHCSAETSKLEREPFRSLHARLLIAGTVTPRVVLVTSPGPSEGKSHVARGLAQAIAQSGTTVLLLDADVHRPCPQNNLGISDARGKNDSPVCQEEVARLHQLIAITTSSALEHLQHSNSEYETIIIDTPPLLAFADALLLAPHADTVLLVARAGQTSHESLQRAHELLDQLSTPDTAVVLNDLDFQSSAYRHYYGHSYRPPASVDLA